MGRGVLAGWIATIIFGLSGLTGCYYDNEEELYPTDTTQAVNYSGVAELLSRNGCIGCHGQNPLGNSYRLDTYENVKAQAERGALVGAVRQTSGFAAMPPTGGRISEADIRQIERWVAAGMPEN